MPDEQIITYSTIVLEEKVKAFALQVAADDKPFKVFARVTKWRAQYLQAKRRYKFLILDGDSMWGKTCYAMALWGEASTVYCYCSGGAVPDLRKFDSDVHKAIVLDEMSLKQAIEFKRLLQAPHLPVALGTSATQMYTYDVWVARTGIILTTNKFDEDLAKLSLADRKWIEKNSKLVKVKDYMYEHTGSDSACASDSE